MLPSAWSARLTLITLRHGHRARQPGPVATFYQATGRPLGQNHLVAASYCSTTLAGIRPRALIGMPCSFAHALMPPLR